MTGYQIPAEVADRLRALQEVARELRGSTAEDSPVRAAATAYSALLWQQKQAGATFEQLGAAAGVSWSAIKQRLGRYGYIPLQASQAHTSIGER